MAPSSTQASTTPKSNREKVELLLATLPIAPKQRVDLLPIILSVLSGSGAAPKIIIVTGPSGAGKTYIAKAIAALISSDYSVENADALCFLSNIEKLKEAVICPAKKVVILDSADGLMDTLTDRSTAFLKAASSTLVDCLESQAFKGLLIACSTNSSIDRRLSSRAAIILNAVSPDEISRNAFIGSFSVKWQLSNEGQRTLVDATERLSLREISCVIETIARDYFVSGKSMSFEGWRKIATSIGSSGGTTVRSASWSDLELEDGIKGDIYRSLRIWKSSRDLAAKGINLTVRPILLVGPPGTGKTMIARVLASESNAFFYAPKSSELKAGFIGRSAGMVSEAFDYARSKGRSIMFIDEFESLTPNRTSYGFKDAINSDVVAAILTEMDGVSTDPSDQPWVIAATNNLDQVDPAIISRFDVLYIGLPGSKAREGIITGLFSQFFTAFSAPSHLTSMLVERTEGWSGRDLRAAVERAARAHAVRLLDGAAVEITLEDFGDITPKSRAA